MIVLAAMGVALVGCGSGDGGGDGVASLGTTDGTVSESEGATADADDAALEAPEDIEEAMDLFQRCMEDHGVETPEGVVVSRDGEESIAVGGAPPMVFDSTNDADGDTPPVDDDEASEGAAPPPIDVEEIEAANEACRGHLENAAPQFDLTPEQEAAMEDAQLEFSQCMEEQGVELPEMAAGADDLGVHVEVFEEGVGDAPPPIDPEELEAASQVCQKIYDQYPELDDVFGEGGMAGPAIRVSEAGEP
jgi:hypothetical protein